MHLSGDLLRVRAPEHDGDDVALARREAEGRGDEVDHLLRAGLLDRDDDIAAAVAESTERSCVQHQPEPVRRSGAHPRDPIGVTACEPAGGVDERMDVHERVAHAGQRRHALEVRLRAGCGLDHPVLRIHDDDGRTCLAGRAPEGDLREEPGAEAAGEGGRDISEERQLLRPECLILASTEKREMSPPSAAVREDHARLVVEVEVGDEQFRHPSGPGHVSVGLAVHSDRGASGSQQPANGRRLLTAVLELRPREVLLVAAVEDAELPRARDHRGRRVERRHARGDEGHDRTQRVRCFVHEPMQGKAGTRHHLDVAPRASTRQCRCHAISVLSGAGIRYPRYLGGRKIPLLWGGGRKPAATRLSCGAVRGAPSDPKSDHWSSP